MQAINMQEVETAMNKYGDIVLTKNEKNNVIVLSVEQYKEKLLDEEIDKFIKENINNIDYSTDFSVDKHSNSYVKKLEIKKLPRTGF